jgi:hypothetical protein
MVLSCRVLVFVPHNSVGIVSSAITCQMWQFRQQLATSLYSLVLLASTTLLLPSQLTINLILLALFSLSQSQSLPFLDHHNISHPLRTTITMQSTDSKPYITAILSSTNPTLDLSGKQPFTLSITLTLHASAPILAYISPHDTFFLPRNALTDIGICFTNHHTKQHIQSCHIDSCRRPGFARRMTEKSRLVLQPEVPGVFEVPFTINSEKERDAGGFDAWFATVTSGFEDAGVYEATLPMYRKLDWWRYATSSDLQLSFTEQDFSTKPSFSITNTITAGIKTTISSLQQWFTPNTETKYGVPVLPYEQQLPIYIEAKEVVFSCVGEKMQWPTEILEKQRENKQRRDGEQKRIAKEKRQEREGEK